MIGTSGRQRTHSSSFETFMILAPPLDLANRFGNIARAIMTQIRENDNESRILAQIRDTLLPKLMRGEVNVLNYD
jgi:type I restriction enzyme S subunit